MRFSAGEIGVLGVTFNTGVTGRSEGGAGALRGLLMDDGSVAPKRDAACSFRMAISSSETPGKETVSCLKLKGAEICSGAFSEGVGLDLTPTSAWSLAVKLRKPPMQLAILAVFAGVLSVERKRLRIIRDDKKRWQQKMKRESDGKDGANF